MSRKLLVPTLALVAAGGVWWATSTVEPDRDGVVVYPSAGEPDIGANADSAATGPPQLELPERVRAPLGASAPARSAPLAEPGVTAAEQSASLDNLNGLEPFLESFRSAMMSTAPYANALPSVRKLSRALSTERREGSKGAGGAPERSLIASVLQCVAGDEAQDGTPEPSFVRAAVLISQGLSLPISEARALGESNPLEGDDELSRAALVLRHLVAEGGVQLGAFQASHSKANRGTWPLRVSSDDSADDWMARVEVRESSAFSKWSTGEASSAGGESFDEMEAIANSIATTELTLLVGLGARAGELAVRPQMIAWAEGGEGSHAAIWSLCHAAVSDESLQKDLAQLLLRLEPGSSEFALLAELMIQTVKCPELVVGRLIAVLADGYDDSTVPDAADIGVIRSALLLSKLMASEDALLRSRATNALMDVSLQAQYPDDLRLVALYELAGEAPERVGEVLELILVQPDRSDVKLTAAVLASAMSSSHSRDMTRILKDTYSPGMPADLQEAYARALMALGLDDGRETLRLIQGENLISSAVDRDVTEYLGN